MHTFTLDIHSDAARENECLEEYFIAGKDSPDFPYIQIGHDFEVITWRENGDTDGLSFDTLNAAQAHVRSLK